MNYYDEMYNPMDKMDEDEYYFHQQQAINEEWEWYEHEQSLKAKSKNGITESFGKTESKSTEKIS